MENVESINFPTVGRIDGQYRLDLEAAGQAAVTDVAYERGLFGMAHHDDRSRILHVAASQV